MNPLTSEREEGGGEGGGNNPLTPMWSLPPPLRATACQDAPWSVRLAAKLLREVARGSSSPWFHYVQVGGGQLLVWGGGVAPSHRHRDRHTHNNPRLSHASRQP